jgi:hypothetical protein
LKEMLKEGADLQLTDQQIEQEIKDIHEQLKMIQERPDYKIMLKEMDILISEKTRKLQERKTLNEHENSQKEFRKKIREMLQKVKTDAGETIEKITPSVKKLFLNQNEVINSLSDKMNKKFKFIHDTMTGILKETATIQKEFNEFKKELGDVLSVDRNEFYRLVNGLHKAVTDSFQHLLKEEVIKRVDDSELRLIEEQIQELQLKFPEVKKLKQTLTQCKNRRKQVIKQKEELKNEVQNELERQNKQKGVAQTSVNPLDARIVSLEQNVSKILNMLLSQNMQRNTPQQPAQNIYSVNDQKQDQELEQQQWQRPQKRRNNRRNQQQQNDQQQFQQQQTYVFPQQQTVQLTQQKAIPQNVQRRPLQGYTQTNFELKRCQFQETLSNGNVVTCNNSILVRNMEGNVCNNGFDICLRHVKKNFRIDTMNRPVYLNDGLPCFTPPQSMITATGQPKEWASQQQFEQFCIQNHQKFKEWYNKNWRTITVFVPTRTGKLTLIRLHHDEIEPWFKEHMIYFVNFFKENCDDTGSMLFPQEYWTYTTPPAWKRTINVTPSSYNAEILSQNPRQNSNNGGYNPFQQDARVTQVKTLGYNPIQASNTNAQQPFQPLPQRNRSLSRSNSQTNLNQEN